LPADVDDAHHAEVFVIEDVAVVDTATRIVRERHAQADLAVSGNEDDVL
jgi:hypothetical protein